MLKFTRVFVFCILVFCSTASPGWAKVLTLSCGAVGKELELCRSAAEAWAQSTGNQVNIVTAASGSGDRLGIYQLFLAAESSDIDVFIVDTTWPGIIGDFFIDLKKYLKEEQIQKYFQNFIRNNTVADRLVALPWFIDAGVLYYRKDLLEKHREKVPQTWEELTQISKRIQDSERKSGNRKIWGYVFQGRAYEGLTCNALEWIYSYSGGTFIDETGKVTVNNPFAQNALKLASSWVNQISPPGVLNYQEEDARGVFQSGNAVFMRNWPYAWTLGNAPDSPIRGKFGITLLPKGTLQASHSGTLGGWSLAISRFSKHPALAIQLVLALTHSSEQKRRAIEAGLSPTLPELYQDPELLEAFPHYKVLLDAFNHSVLRPSRIVKTRYNQVSSEIWDSIHNMLSNDSTVVKELPKLEGNLNRIGRNGKW